jgi:hypothetical protein
LFNFFFEKVYKSTGICIFNPLLGILKYSA